MVIAGISNIASQEMVIRSRPSETIVLSVLVGTAVGFFVKYLLDKHFVFFDAYQSHVAEIRKLVGYGAFSVGTTVLFWGFELSFWHAFHTVEAKYVGAVLGLSFGNWIKYLLDKRYVFRAGLR